MKVDVVKFYSLGAGGIDSLTGVGLLLMPEITLRVMGVDHSLYQLELIRFIGAFVFAVGSLYLWSLFLERSVLWILWWATAWVRVCVSVVTGGMILRGVLGFEWVAVPLTDLSLAVFQVWWLCRYKEREGL